MTGLNTSIIYTIEQKRAQKAYDKVSSVKKEELKDYRALANRFPAMVVNCGLLQTLAFFSIKKQRRELYDHMEEWFRGVSGPLKLLQEKELLKHVAELSVSNYRAATTETLAFSTWLKRFAEGRYQEYKRERKLAQTVKESLSNKSEPEKNGEIRE